MDIMDENVDVDVLGLEDIDNNVKDGNTILDVKGLGYLLSPISDSVSSKVFKETPKPLHSQQKNFENVLSVNEEEMETSICWATTIPNKHWRKLQFVVSPAIIFGDIDFTLIHDNNGSIKKMVVSRESKQAGFKRFICCTLGCRSRCNSTPKDNRNLIYCNRFTSENAAPFLLKFSLSALIIAEIHSFASYRSTAMGLFKGWYDTINRVLRISNCIPLAVNGLTTCCWNSELINSLPLDDKSTVVGWYFSYPSTIIDNSVINQPMHSILQNLFTKSSSDPFVLLSLSPFSRNKRRCITTLRGFPHLIDFKITFSGLVDLPNIRKKMKEAKLNGDKDFRYFKKCKFLNNKTYGQLCYESIRRMLDSTEDSMPVQDKNELILITKSLVGYSNWN